MKLRPLKIAALVLSFTLLSILGTAAAGTNDDARTNAAWTAVNRKPNETHWQAVAFRTNAINGMVFARTNTFIEIGAGLNKQVGPNTFVAANPSFQITAEGAEANDSGHHVSVPGDIWDPNGIQITTPDGQRLSFVPLGIDYYDPATGRSVLLDAVTNVTGCLVSSNVVVYSNCFQRIKASIRLTNGRSGVECDLLLHEQPPEPGVFGLGPNARLEMLTEQIAGPTPQTRGRVISGETGPGNFVEPALSDAELNFGAMKMITGRAFSDSQTNDFAQSSGFPAQVGKTYLILGDRRVVIEAVPYQNMAPALNKLPMSEGLTTNASLNR
ncbi:MAG TPA: hypothetical protein VK530_20415, partial [Candidatus Acidoferrum sp.]|nr:hypothetical protein [Candidatus Acidoferrum sp.]